MVETIKPPKYPQSFLFAAGLCLRIVNKIRRTVLGYTSPRPRAFSSKHHIERNVNYSIKVVTNWEKTLISYTGEPTPFHNKHVLELGPGPDLGTGLVVLAHGAKSYTAFDKNRLIYKTPESFYDVLLDHLRALPGYTNAKAAVNNLHKGNFTEGFNYIWDPYFSLQKLPSKKYDVLVSQAVLEHLVDVRKIYEILYYKLTLNAVMVHEVDLGTHTALIRTMDPLNLLRYPDWIWNLLKFDGSPNRIRMSNYREILHLLKFKDIITTPITVLNTEYVRRTKPNLWSRFKDYPDEDIKTKSFHLLATK